mmetsp:Transcript_42688/g.59824  ORF Transcript_42688/g.59824 Transcript_42688/m.59824 type:complete len:80 (+) Transcript_42688:527-766(+)
MWMEKVELLLLTLGIIEFKCIMTDLLFVLLVHGSKVNLVYSRDELKGTRKRINPFLCCLEVADECSPRGMLNCRLWTKV